MTGLLITMEGVEGSGKSTQIQRLAARLRRAGAPVEVSKEPGGTVLGRELRALLLEPHPSGETWAPKAELMLFYADRAQHIARFITPMLEQGRVVLLDRFDDSTRAYQGAQGIADAVLDRMGEVVLGRLKPTLTIILDMDPAESLVRVGARNGADRRLPGDPVRRGDPGVPPAGAQPLPGHRPEGAPAGGGGLRPGSRRQGGGGGLGQGRAPDADRGLPGGIVFDPLLVGHRAVRGTPAGAGPVGGWAGSLLLHGARRRGQAPGGHGTGPAGAVLPPQRLRRSARAA